MKPHGKGKISSGQSIHIYLRISRNLQDEIFPKGVGVVTPKFLFGFFKRFYLTWGRWIKKFLQKEPPFQIFFLMTRVLFGFTQDLLLVLEVLAFLFELKTKYFSLEKNAFWKSLWNCTMAFGIILYHFQQIPLAMALVQIHSPKPSLIFGSWFASNPASWTSPYDYFSI